MQVQNMIHMNKTVLGIITRVIIKRRHKPLLAVLMYFSVCAHLPSLMRPSCEASYSANKAVILGG